jgi:hypothetical protein
LGARSSASSKVFFLPFLFVVCPELTEHWTCFCAVSHCIDIYFRLTSVSLLDIWWFTYKRDLDVFAVRLLDSTLLFSFWSEWHKLCSNGCILWSEWH